MRLEANQPILTLAELDKLKNIDNLTNKHFKSVVIDITYIVNNDESNAQALERALLKICDDANQSVKDGYNIIILTDRSADRNRIAIPALLACSATHQFLVKAGNRTNTGLVIDTGSAREVHHFALLAGYGAEAICPWLTYETINTLTDNFNVAQDKFIKAIGKGLNKVMSKMGISTYQSYCGAQIFEAVGLNQIFVDKYFKGTATNIEGIGIKEIAEEVGQMHHTAFGNDPILMNALDAGGEYAFRIRGEEHMWNPESVSYTHLRAHET